MHMLSLGSEIKDLGWPLCTLLH